MNTEQRSAWLLERRAERLLERSIREEVDRRPAVPVQHLELSSESFWIEEGYLASLESVMALNRHRRHRGR